MEKLATVAEKMELPTVPEARRVACSLGHVCPCYWEAVSAWSFSLSISCLLNEMVFLDDYLCLLTPGFWWVPTVYGLSSVLGRLWGTLIWVAPCHLQMPQSTILDVRATCTNCFTLYRSLTSRRAICRLASPPFCPQTHSGSPKASSQSSSKKVSRTDGGIEDAMY